MVHCPVTLRRIASSHGDRNGVYPRGTARCDRPMRHIVNLMLVHSPMMGVSHSSILSPVFCKCMQTSLGPQGNQLHPGQLFFPRKERVVLHVSLLLLIYSYLSLILSPPLLLPSLLLPLPLTDVDQLSWVKWREGLILQYGNLNLMTIEELKDSLFPNQQTRAGVKIFKDGHWDPIRYISCTIYSFQYSKAFFAGEASSSLYFVHVFAHKNHNNGSACVCSSAITDDLGGLASLANSGKTHD